MKFYKEIGYNPFSSCLPTLVQLPLIFALYQSITQALAATPMDLLHLTQRIYPGFINIASLLPMQSKFLWMDLAQPERLYLPFLPTFGIPVLAVLVVITTYMQSKLITPPVTPGEGSNSGAGMMKAMNLYMPFLMGWIAYSYSSGLSLYFLVGNIIGILQYAALGKINWRNLLPMRSEPATTKSTAVKKAK
jgi:YidC/Oxa1 family membrane protein insertase